MRRTRWGLLFVIFLVGGFLGAGFVIGSTFLNQYTSTNAFCTSCHSMAFVGKDPHFIHSAHRSNNLGVHPSCGDCHIVKTNWFDETANHITSGFHDVIAEYTHNYSDPKIWAKRRIELAHRVRENMRAQDSITCRSCHNRLAVRPTSTRGKAAHALMREGRMTCIDCHFNLVHAPVPPTMTFIRGSGISRGTK